MILIKALWGEAGPTRNCEKATRVWEKTTRWTKVVEFDIRDQRNNPEEQIVYVYGKSNADLLTSLNYRVVLLHDDPWPDGNVETVADNGRDRLVPWYYKFQMIRQAVQDHGQVIYSDWDVHCNPSLLGLAEDLLGDRKSAFSQYMYLRSIRHPNRVDPAHKRCGISGSWLYFTDCDFVDQILERMKQPGERNWLDEYVMGDLLDEKYGGWMGEVEWLTKYESPIMYVRNAKCLWKRQVIDDQTTHIDTPVDFTWHRIFW